MRQEVQEMSEQDFKAFELKVKPDGYGDLNKPLPETVPKPNVGCGIRNDECFGLIFCLDCSTGRSDGLRFR